MELGLRDKVVIVTGGTRGIGADVALGFAEEGARVAICARTAADLDRVAGEIGRATGATVIGVPADLGKRGEPERLVGTVVDRLGRLDVLVNSAGLAPGGNIEELSDDDWERGIQLKLLGLVRCTRAAIPVMRGQGGGRIVNVVGNDGVKCAYWEIVPAICCAAELIFTATIAEEYGPEGIYVNAVNPGPVETGLMRGLFAQVARRRGLDVDEVVDAHVDSIPLKLGRIAEPREVTNVILFLASDRASFVNGVSVNIDGGQMKPVLARRVYGRGR
ncbi:MAG TPA: SDR family NAD(P)-dependent oxidoreductase [Candidatus Methylomirabilis sp.]|nr:SDR family NAD(P)-dependent oxidoreductase [Candidatus Methylomirabilis sp.]